ncbi:MAG TPA: prepilin-type N-terminal cleavage/methylation domain-containing protein [bacterium]|nr:prepilin-type N-terminal cleavage/methylation domain-containing protein [bacterium]HQL60698.1 prepilin-type N-terminal cleavage/methylation domain-containing protein [bacterium]
MKTVRCGFTLIELLIVVAIIGILAAIAVPNFMNARTRANVARVMGDHKAIGSALEMYRLDHNDFPWPIGNGQGHSGYSVYVEYLHELTTPVAYIATVAYTDIFRPQRENTQWYPEDTIYSYQYVSYNGSWARLSNVSAAMHDRYFKGYCISSYGPDKGANGVEWVPIGGSLASIYNPSNGLISAGDIGRFGGDVPAATVLGG